MPSHRPQKAPTGRRAVQQAVHVNERRPRGSCVAWPIRELVDHLFRTSLGDAEYGSVAENAMAVPSPAIGLAIRRRAVELVVHSNQTRLNEPAIRSATKAVQYFLRAVQREAEHGSAVAAPKAAVPSAAARGCAVEHAVRIEQ